MSTVAQTITLEEVGARLYVAGDTYRVKGQLKAAGCHWDGDRRMWWIGKAKRSEIEAVVAKSQQASSEPVVETPSQIQVRGKARYKGRSYYVRWAGTTKHGFSFHLVTLDGKLDFWAKGRDPMQAQPSDAANVDVATWEKTYQEPKTLGSIQRFLDELKRDDQAKQSGTAETKRCWECGCRFTRLDAKRNGGDWGESYCGC